MDWTNKPNYSGAADALVKRLGFFDYLHCADPRLFRRLTDAEVRDLYAMVGTLAAGTASPIEATMAAELACVRQLFIVHPSDQAALEITLQEHIGPHRVDFVVRVVHPSRSIKIVVECDGHDFHERTKDQAARDRSRDRDLMTKGYGVLRFTGSEIHRDSFRCGDEFYNYVLAQCSGVEA